MNNSREDLIRYGLAQLPPIPSRLDRGRNGESLATDEAAVWKRVLNYRIASYLQPERILETHPGFGVSSYLYRLAAPDCRILVPPLESHLATPCELVDVDPFGAPWETLGLLKPILKRTKVLLVSNGEAHAVRRNLRKAQKYPSPYFGRQLPKWVVREFLPKLEEITGIRVKFFYAFPTTVRVILSRQRLPKRLWRGCPPWMWWLRGCAVDV